MYVCVYLYVYMHACVFVFVCARVYVCVHVFVCVCTCYPLQHARTSSKSLQRCRNASMCAKIGDTLKSQGFGERAQMAFLVTWYRCFQASMAWMLWRRASITSSTCVFMCM